MFGFVRFGECWYLRMFIFFVFGCSELCICGCCSIAGFADFWIFVVLAFSIFRFLDGCIYGFLDFWIFGLLRVADVRTLYGMSCHDLWTSLYSVDASLFNFALQRLLQKLHVCRDLQTPIRLMVIERTMQHIRKCLGFPPDWPPPAQAVASIFERTIVERVRYVPPIVAAVRQRLLPPQVQLEPVRLLSDSCCLLQCMRNHGSLTTPPAKP